MPSCASDALALAHLLSRSKAVLGVPSAGAHHAPDSTWMLPYRPRLWLALATLVALLASCEINPQPGLPARDDSPSPSAGTGTGPSLGEDAGGTGGNAGGGGRPQEPGQAPGAGGADGEAGVGGAGAGGEGGASLGGQAGEGPGAAGEAGGGGGAGDSTAP